MALDKNKIGMIAAGIACVIYLGVYFSTPRDASPDTPINENGTINVTLDDFIANYDAISTADQSTYFIMDKKFSESDGKRYAILDLGNVLIHVKADKASNKVNTISYMTSVKETGNSQMMNNIIGGIDPTTTKSYRERIINNLSPDAYRRSFDYNKAVVKNGVKYSFDVEKDIDLAKFTVGSTQQ